ncbi:MAG: copper homeostasis periplasmic binding protein CopC [Roseiarcus sp.]|jgi:hypothetical protein
MTTLSLRAMAAALVRASPVVWLSPAFAHAVGGELRFFLDDIFPRHARQANLQVGTAMIRRSIAKSAAALAFVFAATAADAHPQLEKAAPAVGSTVASPAEIRLKFSEGVEPRFSSIALSSESGAAAPLGALSLDPADDSVLIAKVVNALAPGVYAVTWHAVSVDAHKTQGSFDFTVKP